MKVKLIKGFKNHPAGMEIDVTPRIYKVLLGIKCVEKIKRPEKAKASEETKALKEPIAHKMITEEQTKEVSVDKEASGAGKEQSGKK